MTVTFSRFSLPTSLCSLALLATACVAPNQYEYSQAWAHDYQQQALEAQDRVIQLEGQVADLEARLRDKRLTDASFSGDADSGQLDQRIEDLKARIAGLGRPMGDIERFDVDGGYVFIIGRVRIEADKVQKQLHFNQVRDTIVI